MRVLFFAFVISTTFVAETVSAQDKPADLSKRIAQIDARVLAADKPWNRMLADDVRRRLDSANRRESQSWHRLKSRADWDSYRDERIKKLRESVGTIIKRTGMIDVEVTNRLEGEGYTIENLVFDAGFGVPVAANLYRPVKPRDGMAGIVIVHSHHNGKTQSELQAMGIGWAKQGAAVIVPDLLGHGERRQHPFTDNSKYPTAFRSGRQDYYFRYNLALQLNLVGQSLIGWMANDLMACADVLLQRLPIDPERLAIFGSVAGGGDPAAVTAALDPRFKVAAIFNFGGPQPETRFPLADDVESTFDYAGGGSWESTRNLYLSAKDGFLPWVIVGSLAPRKLLYCHEFSWDRDRDPVWKRLQTIYGWHDAATNLAGAQGRGRLSGTSPDATHCNNIGAEHLKSMSPALKRWLDLDPPNAGDKRYSSAELTCFKGDAAKKIHKVHEALTELEPHLAPMRPRFDPNKEIQTGPSIWVTLAVGASDPTESVKATSTTQSMTSFAVERVAIEIDQGVVVPLVLLIPQTEKEKKRPVVVAFSQSGKARFLKEQAAEIARLIESGIAVALPDLRGMGETAPGDSRGRTSTATAVSASELMVGRTLVGLRLKDLRSVIEYLRGRGGFDANRIALWGDSAAKPNKAGSDLAAPLDARDLPNQSEPLGDLLSVLCAVCDSRLAAVFAAGGIDSFRDALASPYLYLPHEVIVPRMLFYGDMSDWVAWLRMRPLKRINLVDARNRPVGERSDESPATWLIEKLKR